ncbi:hypothetical protein DCS32_11200 [Dokdonia sp. Dokd-P16]|uniref:hypothetical protein n=1 Tax=Dokdonia sp. Dokd-P16 TaxID=2173169 RepID=UPI000D5435BE|nr:hypothetical protein [Dokdonia sp. Dokd-P16]AWH74701.1 hypothetical protein DCS32_11200 [Dokdonia sp. Dokd-P16]
MNEVHFKYKNYFFIEIVAFDTLFSFILLYLVTTLNINFFVTLLLVALTLKLIYGIVWISFGTIKWIVEKDSITIEKGIFDSTLIRKKYLKPLSSKILSNIDSEHSIFIGVKYTPKYQNVIEMDFGKSKKTIVYIPDVTVGNQILTNIKKMKD